MELNNSNPIRFLGEIIIMIFFLIVFGNNIKKNKTYKLLLYLFIFLSISCLGYLINKEYIPMISFIDSLRYVFRFMFIFFIFYMYSVPYKYLSTLGIAIKNYFYLVGFFSTFWTLGYLNILPDTILMKAYERNELVALMFFMVIYMIYTKPKYYILFVTIASIGIFSTKAAQAIIPLTLFFFYLGMYSKSIKFKYKIIILVFLIGIFVFFIDNIAYSFFKIFRQTADLSSSPRHYFLLITTPIALFDIGNIFTGAGAGSFATAFFNIDSKMFNLLQIPNHPVFYEQGVFSDNQIVFYLINFGLMGYALFIFMIYKIYKLSVGYSFEYKMIAKIFTLYMIAVMFASPIFSYRIVAIPFFIILGYFYQLKRIK